MAEAGAPDDRIEFDCARFLYREAELLDHRRLEDWLALMDPEIDYRIPVRTTRYARDGDGFSTVAHFMKEDHGTLALRVARLKSDFAWSENPPTRTRRLIGNVRASESELFDGYAVVSNFAAYCFRGDNPTPAVLTGERQDVLVRWAETFRLRRRLVLLDTTVLGMESLSIFL